MAVRRNGARSKAKSKPHPSPEQPLSSREAAVALREESLRAREEAAAEEWLKIEGVMKDLREANEHLVVANLRSQSLAREVTRLYDEATTAMQAKDEFFAEVSHELRNPLTSITGWADLLRRNPDPATITDAARAIAISAALQAKLINDLFDISRIMARKFPITRTEIDLRTVTADAWTAMRPVAERKGVSLRMSAPDPVVVSGDATRLRQVVDNLLSNAVKFTPANGSIDVCLTLQGSEAVLELCDSGEGIDANFLPRIFERHAQADAQRFGGLGLGLAIVKHIVELHGGSVAAASEGKGKGARFTVRLPAVQQDRQSISPEGTIQPGQTR